MSKMDLSVNRSPLKTVVSRKVILFSDISAVNFIVGWNLVAQFFNKKFHIFSVRVPKGENVIVTLPFSLLGVTLIVGLGLFQSPPCSYLQKTLPFLCPLQPHGFGDNCFH